MSLTTTTTDHSSLSPGRWPSADSDLISHFAARLRFRSKVSPLGRLGALHHGVICPSSGALWRPRVISPLPARTTLPCLFWLFDYRSCTSVSALVIIVGSYFVQGTKRPPLRLAGLLLRAHQEANTAATACRPVPPSRSDCLFYRGSGNSPEFPRRSLVTFRKSLSCLLVAASYSSAEHHRTVCLKSRMMPVVGKVGRCEIFISTPITICTP
ncbi:hypothetical protein BKA58DRAFT_105241 [Alternaria rosae]|uniref:uncharacterized protein n=1 Tax=Alternaria rosae TaxID=1187941 RepID=UPI001E8CA6D0|nr:uncharacterized protein BKA58DRAFT_105241 [Alternaria rosae]KAH6878899.1 hypothetical protein BKA58DRAFT_105241 [Alternaria rosae]